MKRPNVSPAKKAEMLANLDNQNALKAADKKQFNKQFRKTPLFIGSWVIRIACLAFFISAMALHNTTSSINEEVLIERTIKRDSTFQAQTQVNSTMYLTTTEGHYIGDISGKTIPGFQVGDTMLIQKNLFGKPTFFTKKDWPYKYELDYGLEAYYIVLFLTLISMGFNDGQDKFTKKILWVFMIADMVAVACYFLF
ncbi:MAG: hypothetical protein V4580_07350 [Bacteroidota bacterium]